MTDEEFLQALYGGLLGRDPDPQGFAFHLAQLQTQVAEPERYRRLISQFLAGTEFRLTDCSRRTPAGRNPFLPDMSGIRFGHAVSLGSFCHAAMALKRAGMRRSSGPFDWIFCNVGAAVHCIEDDFATFLDPRHYEPVALADRQSPQVNLCEHAFYRDRFHVRHLFNHHLPTLAADYAYFQRSVKRFREVLKSSQWKLFVMVSATPQSSADLQPLLAALRAASSKFVLVALQFKVGRLPCYGTAEALRTERLETDLLRVEMDVSVRSNGVEFPGQALDDQNLDRFLRSFQVDAVHQKPQDLMLPKLVQGGSS